VSDKAFIGKIGHNADHTKVVLTLVRGGRGELRIELTPEMADELSADLRNYALEVRNGGRLT